MTQFYLAGVKTLSVVPCRAWELSPSGQLYGEGQGAALSVELCSASCRIWSSEPRCRGQTFSAQNFGSQSPWEDFCGTSETSSDFSYDEFKFTFPLNRYCSLSLMRIEKSSLKYFELWVRNKCFLYQWQAHCRSLSTRAYVWHRVGVYFWFST